MADKQNRPAGTLGNLMHLANGFFLEFGITDGEDFIDDKDVGFEVRGDGEAEADGHAGGVALDGRVEVALAAAEIDDLVQLAVDLVLPHPHDRAVHVDVLAPCHFRVKACAYFKKRRNASTRADSTSGGGGDAG